MENERVLKEGLQKGYKMIVEHLTEQLRGLCERLLLEVPKHRTFAGFTGNTQTSYACGLYVDGKLQGIVIQRNWNAPTKRRKVGYWQWVYLRNPYEGRARSVVGQVMFKNGDGKSTSVNFLQSYKAKRNHICIVMTTGTEYSEYLESAAHLDVLTGTYEASKEILAKGFKPINEG